MTRLSERTRASLSASVAQPAYDRSRAAPWNRSPRPGRVPPCAPGAIHRSGDRRRGQPLGHRRGKPAQQVGSRHSDPAGSALLRARTRGARGAARLVGVLRAALHAPTQLDEVLDALADPETHVVTSTVSEKGYSVHSATGELDVDDEQIRHDLAQSRCPGDHNRPALRRASSPRSRGAADRPVLRQHGRQRRHVAQARGAVRRVISTPTLARRIETHDRAFRTAWSTASCPRPLANRSIGPRSGSACATRQPSSASRSRSG